MALRRLTASAGMYIAQGAEIVKEIGEPVAAGYLHHKIVHRPEKVAPAPKQQQSNSAGSDTSQE